MTQGENIHPCPRKKTKKEKKSSQSKIGRKQKKRKKFPIKDRKKAKEENSQSKIGRKQKEKKKENSRSKVGRKQNKYTERSLDQTLSKQYRIVISKQEKKGNHNLKWSSPLDCQPKSCVLAAFSFRTKQK